jgi:hypothetical protein
LGAVAAPDDLEPWPGAIHCIRLSPLVEEATRVPVVKSQDPPKGVLTVWCKPDNAIESVEEGEACNGETVRRVGTCR